MKKSVITLFLVFALAQSGLAQIDFGPRVSILTSNITLENLPASFGGSDYEVGYQVGLFARIKLPMTQWYLQPEALYSKTGGFLTDPSGKSDYDFQRIDVPVLLGRKLGPLRVNAGPVFKYNVESSVTLPNGGIAFIRNSFKDVTFGYQAGIGVDVMKFVLDLKYEGSMSDVRNSDELFTNLGSVTRVNQWILAVGFKLF